MVAPHPWRRATCHLRAIPRDRRRANRATHHSDAAIRGQRRDSCRRRAHECAVACSTMDGATHPTERMTRRVLAVRASPLRKPSTQAVKERDAPRPRREDSEDETSPSAAPTVEKPRQPGTSARTPMQGGFDVHRSRPSTRCAVRKGGLVFVAELADPLGSSKVRGDVPSSPPAGVARRRGRV